MAEQAFPEPTCGALIFNKENRLFLMKSHKWNNKYVIPGGHVELGERLEDALKREILEETGMKISDIHFVGFQEFIYDSDFWKKRHFIFFDFACKTKADTVKLDSEGQEYIWASLDEINKLPVEPYTLRAIMEFQKRFPEGI